MSRDVNQTDEFPEILKFSVPGGDFNCEVEVRATPNGVEVGDGLTVSWEWVHFHLKRFRGIDIQLIKSQFKDDPEAYRRFYKGEWKA